MLGIFFDMHCNYPLVARKRLIFFNFLFLLVKLKHTYFDSIAQIESSIKVERDNVLEVRLLVLVFLCNICWGLIVISIYCGFL